MRIIPIEQILNEPDGGTNWVQTGCLLSNSGTTGSTGANRTQRKIIKGGMTKMNKSLKR